jgi:hypothetical protein
VVTLLVLASPRAEARLQDRPPTEGDPVRVVEVVFSGFDVLPADRLNAIKAGAVQKGSPVIEERLLISSSCSVLEKVM